jgi:hypothetical protein
MASDRFYRMDRKGKIKFLKLDLDRGNHPENPVNPV